MSDDQIAKFEYNDNIKIPNSLISARYKLNLRAMRLKSMALAQLNPFNYLFGISYPIQITAKDWQSVFIESENPYRDLKIASREFVACTVQFENDPHTYKFLKKAEYQDKQGGVILFFDEDFLIACHVNNLNQGEYFEK